MYWENKGRRWQSTSLALLERMFNTQKVTLWRKMQLLSSNGSLISVFVQFFPRKFCNYKNPHPLFTGCTLNIDYNFLSLIRSFRFCQTQTSRFSQAAQQTANAERSIFPAQRLWFLWKFCIWQEEVIGGHGVQAVSLKNATCNSFSLSNIVRMYHNVFFLLHGIRSQQFAHA